ncbi:hypothetical protein [Metamycoplasma buccale]|uniref:hypothetical protein n=1 Tax=Metamycoplasma buccale TaxID=55602 RepID=UPI00398E554A
MGTKLTKDNIKKQLDLEKKSILKYYLLFCFFGLPFAILFIVARALSLGGRVWVTIEIISTIAWIYWSVDVGIRVFKNTISLTKMKSIMYRRKIYINENKKIVLEIKEK